MIAYTLVFKGLGSVRTWDHSNSKRSNQIYFFLDWEVDSLMYITV